jgi:hypothetical protein
VNWTLFAQLAVTVVVAVMAAWITHRFASERDAKNERRKLRIQYLLEAYRTLERTTSASQEKGERSAAWEKAASDIQLLGDAEQVRLTQEWVTEFSDRQTALLDPLLASLRQSLRKELGLEKVDDAVKYLRMNPK